ncbi:12637_t:CDS:2, partial [Rhizophagus irregularis]
KKALFSHTLEGIISWTFFHKHLEENLSSRAFRRDLSLQVFRRKNLLGPFFMSIGR